MVRSRLPPPKKSKAVQQNPQTENDFLEVADEHEQGGNKWKAGDAAKAVRFFQRAIDAYNQGLARFPSSFDLAYNKAVLQYQMSQDPRIADSLGDIDQLLDETLQSHRTALKLRSDDANAMFNTAQVLCSAAEYLSDQDNEGSTNDAYGLLKEAIELFNSCLARQELEFSETNAGFEAAEHVQKDTDVDSDPSMSKDSSSPAIAPSEWATVMEPVTPRTLIDTTIELLNALSTAVSLCSKSSSRRNEYAAFASIKNDVMTQKVSQYLSLLPEISQADENEPSARFLSITNAKMHDANSRSTSHPRAEARQEIVLASTQFDCAVAGVEFETALIDAETYLRRITTGFEVALSEGGRSPSLIVAYADKLSEAQLSILISGVPDGSERNYALDMAAADDLTKSLMILRWQALSEAQDLLAEALKIINSPPNNTSNPSTTFSPRLNPAPSSSSSSSPSNQPSLSQLYLSRGDIEVHRLRIAQDPKSGSSVQKSIPVLVKNAGVYYRGAASRAANEGDLENRLEAGVKEAIVRFITQVEEGTGTLDISELYASSGDILEVVRAMVDDRLLSEEEARLLTASGGL